MAEWRATTLGELLREGGGSIKTGPFGTTLSAAEYSTDGVPVISVGEVRHGGFVLQEKTPRVSTVVTDRLPEYVLTEGDIVFARKGAVDRSAYVSGAEDGWFLGSDGIRVRCGAAVDPQFLAFQFQGSELRAWLLQHASGSTMLSLNQPTLERAPVSLPSEREQRAIAEVLSAFDDKIAANTRLAKMSDELVRTTARRGLAKSTDSVRLGDLVTVTKGVSYRSADLVPSDTALVTLKCFSRDGSYAARGLKSYAGDFRAEQVVATGDLAVAQTDLTQAAEVVGRVVSVPPAEEFKTLVASLDLAIVRPKAGVPRGFLLGLLWQDDFRFHCREHTSGTTVLHLARGAIESYVAPRLPADAMASIAAEVEPLASVAPRIYTESQALAATRDALLPALMSGKLRVRDAERFAEAHA